MIEQHNSLAEKFLKKWFWLYLFSFIIAPTGYIIKIILSGDISVSDMGIIYWAMSLMVLLAAFNDFGMTESMNKFIPDFITQKNYNKVKTILFYAFFIQMFTGILIFLLFFFWAGYLAEHYFNSLEAMKVIQIFSLFFLWYNFFQVINTFFVSVQNTFLQKLTEAIRMFFVLWVIFILFILDLGNLASYSWSWVLGLYLWIIFALIFFYRNYYQTYLKDAHIIFDTPLFLEILKYGFFVFLWAQIATILWQVDMQMIIYMLGTTDAGYYSNYLSLIGIPFVILGPIFTFIFPVFSEMYAKKEMNKIRLVKEVFQKNFIVFGLALNILFFVFATNISVVLFWEKFFESWVILQYSVLLLVFNFLLHINFSIFAAIWQVKKRLYIMIIALCFNIVMNIILISVLWVSGAALATGLGWVLIYILSEWMLKDYRVKLDMIHIGKNILFVGFFWILLYIFVVPFLDGYGRMMSLVLLSAISLVYFTIFTLFNWKDIRYFVNEVKKLRKI